RLVVLAVEQLAFPGEEVVGRLEREPKVVEENGGGHRTRDRVLEVAAPRIPDFGDQLAYRPAHVVAERVHQTGRKHLVEKQPVAAMSRRIDFERKHGP